MDIQSQGCKRQSEIRLTFGAQSWCVLPFRLKTDLVIPNSILEQSRSCSFSALLDPVTAALCIIFVILSAVRICSKLCRIRRICTMSYNYHCAHDK